MQLCRRDPCLGRSCARVQGLPARVRLLPLRAAGPSQDKTTTGTQQGKTQAEVTTEKYGLEAGLYQVLTSKEDDAPVSRTEQAKQLLKQYGSAYLLTSISFAIVSFAACYAAVNAGVDVAALLSKIGLTVNDTSEKVGTFAIAYAAHKALSPVRFPPTVALTPVVARWTGGNKQQEQQQQQQQQQQDTAASNGNGNGQA